jgi:cytochrome c nitrite reductase small subunit
VACLRVVRIGSLTVIAAAIVGLAIGLGAYTFVYAKGYSYLTNDPAACANCHVMREHYAAWTRASHHAVATCNDCHTPPGLVPKYVTKARNGFWHSFYFTLGGYPDPLRITSRNHDVTEQACRKCHSELVAAIEPARPSRSAHDTALSCITCHRTVGHLE